MPSPKDSNSLKNCVHCVQGEWNAGVNPHTLSAQEFSVAAIPHILNPKPLPGPPPQLPLTHRPTAADCVVNPNMSPMVLCGEGVSLNLAVTAGPKMYTTTWAGMSGIPPRQMTLAVKMADPVPPSLCMHGKAAPTPGTACDIPADNPAKLCLDPNHGHFQTPTVACWEPRGREGAGNLSHSGCGCTSLGPQLFLSLTNPWLQALPHTAQSY